MKLYHGTRITDAKNIAKSGIDISVGRISTDFGQGFYTTDNLHYAAITAKKRARYENTQPVVIEFDYNIIEKLSMLSFEKESISWLQFIINNRNGIDYIKSIGLDTNFHNIDKKYDVVNGPIADHDIVGFTKMILAEKRKINYNDVKKIAYKYRTHQMSFHTEKALKSLDFVRIINIGR